MIYRKLHGGKPMKLYSSEVIKLKLERKHKTQKVFRIIGYIILALLAVCSAVILYQKIIKKENGVSLFGYSSYIVVSGSMEPSIKVGDLVVIKQANESELDENDIITFSDESGNIVTHRIISINYDKNGKKQYQTKGDNNNSADIGLVTIENVKGKYCFKINSMGKVINTIFSPVGILIIALIIVLAILDSNRRNNRRIARHKLRENYNKKEEVLKQDEKID